MVLRIHLVQPLEYHTSVIQSRHLPDEKDALFYP